MNNLSIVGTRRIGESASATQRSGPAMAVGVTDRLWKISDIVGMLEVWEGNKYGI